MAEFDEGTLRIGVDGILNRWATVGLAVGMVRRDSMEFFRGHGLADIASGTPVTQDTVFRIASITKTFTAIAVMQLSEQGLIDLDGPAGRYLRAYRLAPAKAGFRPATIRHLLTHTAGIREVLHPSGPTVAEMFQPHYQADPRIPGIGLAFFRTDLGDHFAVEHQGLLPGFDSHILVAPDDATAVMAFVTGSPGPLHWLASETSGLMRQLFGVPDPVVRTDIAHHPEVWQELCGWYRFSTRLTDPALFAIGAGAEVVVRRGRLAMRFLSPIPGLWRAMDLHPDDQKDPYVFRFKLPWFGAGTDTGRVLFSRKPGVGVTGMHFDFVPISLAKQPAATNPRPWATGVAAAMGVAAAVTAVGRRRKARAEVGS